MYIRSLSLRHFRTYNRLELDLPPAPVLLLGANAQGKTSLLEAMAFLALGSSPLTNVDQHVIHWDAAMANMPFAHLKTEIVRKTRVETIEIALEHKALTNGQQRMHKSIRVDQRVVRRSELAGHLNVVLFLPEDLDLIAGAPAGRRRYLDNLLSQVYPTYVDVYETYRKAVSRRNALLRHLRERGGDPLQLAPLEERIVRTGVTVSLYRRRVIRELALHIDRLHRDLTGGQAWLQLQYEPNFDPVRPPALDYQMGLLAEAQEEPPVDIESLYEAYRRSLARQRRQEIERGMTLTGPDSVIMENGIEGATITEYTFTVPPVDGHSGSDFGRVRGYNKLTGQWDQLDYGTTSNGITFTRTLGAGVYTQLEFYYYTNHNCMYNKSNITYSVTYHFE